MSVYACAYPFMHPCVRVHTHARDNGYTYDRVTGDRIKDVKERR